MRWFYQGCAIRSWVTGHHRTGKSSACLSYSESVCSWRHSGCRWSWISLANRLGGKCCAVTHVTSCLLSYTSQWTLHWARPRRTSWRSRKWWTQCNSSRHWPASRCSQYYCKSSSKISPTSRSSFPSPTSSTPTTTRKFKVRNKRASEQTSASLTSISSY